MQKQKRKNVEKGEEGEIGTETDQLEKEEGRRRRKVRRGKK